MSAIGRSHHTTRWISVSDISVIWAQSQRPFTLAWAKRIAENFDPDMVGTISVTSVDKNGKYHVIDGQHRLWAITQVLGMDQKVPCNVFEAADPKRAAELFDAMNTSRRAPRAIETFLVRVTAGSEPEAGIHKTVTGLGFKIKQGPVDGHLTATGACLHVAKKSGLDGLADTLIVLRSTWGKVWEAGNGNIIKGMGDFLVEYGDAVDRKRLATRLSASYTPARLLGSARAMKEMFRGTTGDNVARVLKEAYNHGLRNGRLDE